MIKYYVQRLASQSTAQITPILDNTKIPQRYLNNITNDEFISAFNTYQSILRQIYGDIIENPESFGMVCLNIDETNSGHILFHIPTIKMLWLYRR